MFVTDLFIPGEVQFPGLVKDTSLLGTINPHQCLYGSMCSIRPNAWVSGLKGNVVRVDNVYV